MIAAAKGRSRSEREAPAASVGRSGRAQPGVASAPKAAKPPVTFDKSKMSIDDMVAWCREHDTK